MKRACFLVAICLVGVLAPGCGGDQAKQELSAARATISEERETATRDIAHQRSIVAGRIRREKAVARREVKEELSRARGQLGALRDKITDARSQASDAKGTLARLQSQVGDARATAAKNTFPGTGTFLVGSDVNPGTYRAEPQSGCYWARLSSLNTSDIIDNDNADGPVVLEISSSDKAFQASGCGDFHRIG